LKLPESSSRLGSIRTPPVPFRIVQNAQGKIIARNVDNLIKRHAQLFFIAPHQTFAKVSTGYTSN
jgi:hypothetical protein